jgi:hypothetical protein
MFQRVRRVTEHMFLIIIVVGSTAAHLPAATISGLSQLGGWVYIDRNNDGALAFSTDPNPEYVIGDVVVNLFSVSGGVETLAATTQTSPVGRFLFENVTPGTYTLREAQPVEFVDGLDTLGQLQSLNGQPISGAASTGVMSNNAFSDIVLTPDVGGEFYLFGERGLAAGYVSKKYLFASAPPPNTPPGNPPGDPPPGGSLPEPFSITYVLMAGCGGWLMPRRRRWA